MTNETNIISEFNVLIGTAGEKYHKIIEEQIKLVIKPKPKLLPMCLWKYLLSRLIYMEKKKLKGGDKEWVEKEKE